MKIKKQGSKLKIHIPDDIDRAIGDNARQLVNECGRVVRTRAPLDVKTWQEAFARAGDAMWKEIQDKFQIDDGGCHLKMQAFVIDTMQRQYRVWKARLHDRYKSAKADGKSDAEIARNHPPEVPQEQWEFCVKRFGSKEFQDMSKRNSTNRNSDTRSVHTTGNLSFAEVEDILTQENDNVKPTADTIWLVEHTNKDAKGELRWADKGNSKKIYDKLKEVVAASGDSMT